MEKVRFGESDVYLMILQYCRGSHTRGCKRNSLFFLQMSIKAKQQLILSVVYLNLL